MDSSKQDYHYPHGTASAYYAITVILYYGYISLLGEALIMNFMSAIGGGTVGAAPPPLRKSKPRNVTN